MFKEMVEQIENIRTQLAPLRQQLMEHEVFRSMHTIEDLQIFTEHHVFAIWDYMSLLKALQRDLTCITVPWVPKGHPTMRRLINELVLEEETLLDLHDQPASFFELYLRGMDTFEANTRPMRQLWELIMTGNTVEEALNLMTLPESVRGFVKQTFEIIGNGKTHEIAAALTLGRQDVLPGMFRQMIKDLKLRFPELMGEYTYYVDRHLKHYKNAVNPLAMRMISELCGSNPQRWDDCLEVTRKCLEARLQLWDGVLQELQASHRQQPEEL